MKEIPKEFENDSLMKSLFLSGKNESKKDEKQKTPIFDILQILSVTDENKDTK